MNNNDNNINIKNEFHSEKADIFDLILNNNLFKKTYRSSNRVICSRCGMEVMKYTTHKVLCERVPLPSELVIEFRSNKYLTQVDIGKKYNVSPKFIRDRLIYGGVGRKEREERKNLANPNNSKTSYTVKKNKKTKHCPICTILIESDVDICIECKKYAVRKAYSEYKNEVDGVYLCNVLLDSCSKDIEIIKENGHIVKADWRL